jgi:hypothetical protein
MHEKLHKIASDATLGVTSHNAWKQDEQIKAAETGKI